MAGGRVPSLSILLHELAEGLQSAGTYLGAARRAGRGDVPAPAAAADLIDKAANEFARVEAAFHRLRERLSRPEPQHGLRPGPGLADASNPSPTVSPTIPHDFAGKS